MKIFLKSRVIICCLLFIFILGASLRLYGNNWDQGFHLHPDERMITMVTLNIHLPQSREEWRTFFTPQSPLNPKFFPYGSFPIYFLHFTGVFLSQFGTKWLGYDKINLLGRGISALFDSGVILLIYLLGKKIWSRKTGLLGAFFYTVSVFPIQAAHFYAVDSLLNFFILATLYRLVFLYEKPSVKNAFWVGIFFGLSLATKVSATVLLAAVGVALLADLILIFVKRVRQIQLIPKIHKELFEFVIWIFSSFKTPKKQRLLKIIFSSIKFFVVITIITATTFLIFEPYALIDSQTFWRQTKEQQAMTKDAFVFPYTLQYVDTTPYLYHLKNFVLWGAGIPLGLISIIATLWLILLMVKEIPKPGKENQEAKIIILISFFLAYFFVVGRFAIKFMRYLLPLYPLFSLFASLFLNTLIENKKKVINFLGKTILVFTLTSTFLWALAFVSIYSKPHTRVVASKWINQNISPGSKLANEHWDDGLPLYGGEKYQSLEMPMYGFDNDETKWQKVNQSLNEADYLVLSSNRLYVPLQRLADCQKFSKRCYPKTAQYYRDLFSEKLGFIKSAEFTSYPTLKLGKFKIEISDFPADESFTVYDHPKVIIFKNENKQN